jgi:hypothetical protein
MLGGFEPGVRDSAEARCELSRDEYWIQRVGTFLRQDRSAGTAQIRRGRANLNGRIGRAEIFALPILSRHAPFRPIAASPFRRFVLPRTVEPSWSSRMSTLIDQIP